MKGQERVHTHRRGRWRVLGEEMRGELLCNHGSCRMYSSVFARSLHLLQPNLSQLCTFAHPHTHTYAHAYAHTYTHTYVRTYSHTSNWHTLTRVHQLVSVAGVSVEAMSFSFEDTLAQIQRSPRPMELLFRPAAAAGASTSSSNPALAHALAGGAGRATGQPSSLSPSSSLPSSLSSDDDGDDSESSDPDDANNKSSSVVDDSGGSDDSDEDDDDDYDDGNQPRIMSLQERMAAALAQS